MSEEVPFLTGWVTCRLPDFTNITMGQSPPSETYNTHGVGLPFFQGKAEFGEMYPTVLKYCTKPKKIAEAGSVLLSIRAPVGPTNLAKEKCCIGRGLTAIYALGDISPQFVLYLLRNLEPTISKAGTGSTFTAINKNFLEELKINLPPLNEQKRIVAKIEELFSELDKGVESLQKAQAQLKVYRKALLKHAFEGRLTAGWRAQHQHQLETGAQLLARIQQERQERYTQEVAEWEKGRKQGKKPQPPKELPPLTPEELAELPELPAGWVWVKAEEISDFITKGTTPSKNDLFAGSGDIPFLKVYNLTHYGWLDFSINPTFVSKDTHNGFLARSVVYPNDVLMNIVGPPLGKVSVVPNFYPEWNINQAIVRFRSTFILSGFLANYFLFDKTIKNMMKKAKATAGQFNLTLEICREIPIPLCSQAEQSVIVQEISAKLSNLDQLEQTIAENLQKAEVLRQAILHKAFSGRLVPQDPQDEPAHQLLQRLQAQK